MTAEGMARLLRCQEMMESGKAFLRVHGFENFPQGITTSATSLPDWILIGLSRVFSSCEFPLVEAGFWAGPVLAMGFTGLLVLFMHHCSGSIRKFRHFYLLTFCLALPVVHLTAPGNPGPGMLFGGLFALLFVSEIRRWQEEDSRWFEMITAGLWGLLFWIALWQAALVFIAWCLFNLAFRGRERPFMLLLAVGIGIGFWVFERFPAHGAMLVSGPEAARWMEMLPEVQPAHWKWWVASGWGLLPVIFYLVGQERREVESTQALWIGLSASLLLLAVWQLRWLPLWTLISSLLVVQAMPVLNTTTRWTSLAFQFLPMIAGLFLVTPVQTPSYSIRVASAEMQQQGALLAPTSVGPALSFYSGRPLVGGTSSQSLEGNLSTARFLTAKDLSEAENIIRERGIKYVALTNLSTTLNSAYHLLGIPPQSRQPEATLAWKLWHQNREDSRFHLAMDTGTLRLFRVSEVLNSGRPPFHELVEPNASDRPH